MDETIQAALELVATDDADTVAKIESKDQADAAEAAATHAAEVAEHDREAAVNKQNADLDAALKLLESKYRRPI